MFPSYSEHISYSYLYVPGELCSCFCCSMFYVGYSCELTFLSLQADY